MKQVIEASRAKKQATVWLLFIGLFLPGVIAVQGKEAKPVWGVSAISLGAPCATPPSVDELLSGQKNTVCLDSFYCVGGKNTPATPTICHLAYDSNTLYVAFACTENALEFPARQQPGDWYALTGLPSDQDAVFPDKVDFFFQPDRQSGTYYQFAVMLNGRTFACEHRSLAASKNPAKTVAEDDNEASTSPFKKINGYTATVTKRDRQWLVFLQIPWQTIGGQPQPYFGLLPVRTRWRNGEVSSPVAFDFVERTPLDLFIEAHFSDAVAVQTYATNLCQLPSGTWRWQRPARLMYPDAATQREIWQLQLSLGQPTDADNFAQRLYLTQCWVDLLTQDGFNFRAAGGGIAKENMMPLTAREKVNTALRKNERPRAWQALDKYLGQLDQVSRDWFADNSPGDIRQEEWSQISELTGWEVNEKVLVLHGLAGKHSVELHLSLPQTGGVRIYGSKEGYFKPADLKPIYLSRPDDSGLIRLADGRIGFRQKPFEISFFAASGNKVTQLGPGNVAFRFDPNGKILAVDFRNDLGPTECIYGFGERYDHFNENGQALTLWGMDDWNGNTVGLMNQTYKPIAMFHSSRGYTVFDNSTYRLRADVGRTVYNQYRLTQAGPIFDYYFWIDSPAKALQSYTDLTGKPVLPPKWAFEPWMGRTGRGWRGAPGHNAVAEEERVTEKFASLDIPHSAIYSEGEGADSAELNQFMAARGIKVLSWFYPVIGPTEQAKLMPEIKPADLPVLNAGSPAATREIGYVDFTNPKALELCRRWWSRRLSLGVAGSMVDFGDRVPEAAVFYNGAHGDEMHNFYASNYHQTYRDVFQEKRGNDFILFARAAAPGSQRWIAQFGGDHPANFAGLQAVLTGALNLSACGFSIWGSDLGGFLGWPEPGVYRRWVEFACFSPLMRCHGRTPREPWNFGDAAVADYKYYAWVRENLLDYIYDAAAASHETGVPMMRSLAVAYPDEPSLSTVPDEYMFGHDLLVAPVVDDASVRRLYFPAGKWTSLWNGVTVAGPTTLETNVSLGEIPVYLRAGAVVPVQLNPALKLGLSMTPGRVDALLMTPPDNAETIPLLNHQGEKASAVLHPIENGFALTLKNLPEKTDLLIYAAIVTGVKVNGQALPQFTGSPADSAAAGWQNDPAGNRVIVRLPSPQAQAGNLKLEREVEIQSKNKNE